MSETIILVNVTRNKIQRKMKIKESKSSVNLGVKCEISDFAARCENAQKTISTRKNYLVK